MPLRPIVAGIYTPTALLSKLLNNLLTTIYANVTLKTTFTNSVQLVQNLENYVGYGYLKSTTKFITVGVENFYTVILQEGGREALLPFLMRYPKQGKIGTLSLLYLFKVK